MRKRIRINFSSSLGFDSTFGLYFIVMVGTGLCAVALAMEVLWKSILAPKERPKIDHRAIEEISAETLEKAILESKRRDLSSLERRFLMEDLRKRIKKNLVCS